MNYDINTILEGKIDPNEIVEKLFLEKNWDLLVNAIIQRHFFQRI